MCEPVNFDFGQLGDWQPANVDIDFSTLGDLADWQPENIDFDFTQLLGSVELMAVDRGELEKRKARITELLDQALEQDRANLAELMAKIREDNTQLESLLAEEREKLAGLMAEIKAESDSLWNELGLQPKPAPAARKPRKKAEKSIYPRETAKRPEQL